ncbi:MAG: type II toxin-antitoxin system VapC family toxin [Rhodoglobus sp.]|nr:type II toxin-antitoxin system VapC family toxin [Rhodoglobus sp.]
MTSEVPVGESFLIDSNVLLDIFGRGPWAVWSNNAVAACLRAGPVHINPVIYSEISVTFPDPLELDLLVPSTSFRRSPIPYPAAFLAAKAHQAYRRRGGTRTATLPDFFIGAHALVEGLTIVTRDARRYRDAFPQVRVVAP